MGTNELDLQKCRKNCLTESSWKSKDAWYSATMSKNMLLKKKTKQQPRGKSLLKIAYVIFKILKSHDFFSVMFCDFSDF